MIIKGRNIGYQYEPLVIAELGINHNGSLKIAKKMVDAASESGIEIIKHQTHIIEDEMSAPAKKIIPGNADKSIYHIMKECALNEEDEYELMNYVHSKGMIFISTPFSRKAVDRLVKFDVPAFKIGSGECNNFPLLEYVASFGKPIILSTGMNDIPTIKKSVKILEKYKVDYALLHTTNLYPTPDNFVRLGALNQLQKIFPNTIVGLSDHSLSNHACFGAVALGACILERHFTDSMKRKGPDIICSMDKEAARELIQGVNIIKQQRGGNKNLIQEEQITRDFAFASLCSIKSIECGEKLTKENIWVKRPGKGGIPAENYDKILNKIAVVDIPKDVQLKYEFFK
jgi:sialic acid synthase SpsE